jgi:hypothetical protein
VPEQRSASQKPVDLVLHFSYHVTDAGITQLVECKLPKLDAEGSSPFARSKLFPGKNCLQWHTMKPRPSFGPAYTEAFIEVTVLLMCCEQNCGPRLDPSDETLPFFQREMSQ